MRYTIGVLVLACLCGPVYAGKPPTKPPAFEDFESMRALVEYTLNMDKLYRKNANDYWYKLDESERQRHKKARTHNRYKKFKHNIALELCAQALKLEQSKRHPNAPKYAIKQLEIPKKLHYIWIGGALKEEDFHNMASMTGLFAHSGYEVHIWTNKATRLDILKSEPQNGSQQTLKQYSELAQDFFEKRKQVYVHDIEELRKETFLVDQQVLTPADWQDYWGFIERECVGLCNFAAAADLLRYVILARHGGLFMNTSLKPLIKPVHSEHLPRIQTLASYTGYGHVYKNNNLMVSTPKNPIMLYVIAEVLWNYLNCEQKEDLISLLELSEASLDAYFDIDALSGAQLQRKRRFIAPNIDNPKNSCRFQTTLYTSGPDALRRVECELKELVKEALIQHTGCSEQEALRITCAYLQFDYGFFYSSDVGLKAYKMPRHIEDLDPQSTLAKQLLGSLHKPDTCPSKPSHADREELKARLELFGAPPGYSFCPVNVGGAWLNNCCGRSWWTPQPSPTCFELESLDPSSPCRF